MINFVVTLLPWIIESSRVFFFQAQVGHLQMQKMVNKVNLWGMLSIFILVVLARLHVTWKIYVQYTWSLSWEVIENGDIFFARVSFLKTILWWNNRPRKEYTQRTGPEILCLPPPKKVRDCALVDEVQSGAWVGVSSVVVVFVFLFLAWHYRTAFKEVCQKIKDLPSKGMSDWHLDHPQEATVWYKSLLGWDFGAVSVRCNSYFTRSREKKRLVPCRVAWWWISRSWRLITVPENESTVTSLVGCYCWWLKSCTSL